MWKKFFTSSRCLVVLVLTLLWLTARMSPWNGHLQVDIWVWWERVDYWFKNHSFSGLSGNEILPLTLIYIFLPAFLVPDGWASYANYLPAALVINLLIVIAHLFLVKKYAPANLTWLGWSLLALGPILLFRFDALVMLITILSFHFFQKKRLAAAGFCLGLATGLKVFPVIFLPYLLLLFSHRLKSVLLMLIYFAEALLLPVLIFFILGGNFRQIGEALNFHNLKLISIESLPGSLMTAWSLLAEGKPPLLIPGYGIWAMAGPALIFNRLWLVPAGLIYYFVWRRKLLLKTFSWGVPFALVLVFLIFSKNLNPQYVWWFMALAPFVNLSKFGWFLILLIGLTNQLVYPIFYSQLIENFYQHNRDYWVYYLLLLRNLAIVGLSYLSLKILYSPESRSKGKLAAK